MAVAPEKCDSLTKALKHYFDPVENASLVSFSKSLTDDEKEEYRGWFRDNGYPNVK